MSGQFDIQFDMSSGSQKKRVPGGPKPSLSRPLRVRSRKAPGQVRGATEEVCANAFVTDLIRGALAEDVTLATEDVTFYDSEEEGMEDDVYSLADPSEDEEEAESIDLANVLAKRVVQQGIQLDMQRAIQVVSENTDMGFEEVEDFDEEEEESLDDLRAKVGSTLVSAALDGSLGATLAQVHEEVQAEHAAEDAALKKEARETLLRAAQSGNLSSALQAINKVPAPPTAPPAPPADLDALRLEARDTLLHAARDGSLAAALQEAREEEAEVIDVTPTPDIELLRQEARDTLLRAAGNGSLASAFRSVRAEAKAEKAESLAELKQEALGSLVSAARDGRLTQVLQTVRQSQQADNFEQMRREAARALVVAANSGRLAEALSQSRESPEADVEALRMEARDTMLRAARDGSLRSALESARVETLRLEARDRLLAAARDGRLAAAMQRPMPAKAGGLEEIREKAKSALLKTLETGDFHKAMETIVQNREAKATPAPAPAPAVAESTPFHLCPSVGTWLMPPSFMPPSVKAQAPAQPQPVEQAVEEKPACTEAASERPSSPTRTTGRTKRRIIGAVVRVPTESLPVDPEPPATSPKSNRPWVMAGSPAAGLRTKEPLAFHLDDDSGCESKGGSGIARKTSITAMFEAMGSTQLYRMATVEDDEVPAAPASRPSSSCMPGMVKSASTGSVSAMALDLGLSGSDLSKKDRLGTPGMGSRCSSVGALRPLKANKPTKQGGMLPFLSKPGSSAIDWSVSHVSVMSMKTHEWSTMTPSPVL